MAELNEQQVELISAYIRQHGVAQDTLHDDLLDHVCTSIERLMDEGQTFEEAFAKTIKLFGPGGLKQVQQQTFELLTEMNETMKKIAFSFGLTSAILLLAGTLFKLLHWPGAGVMFILGSALLVLGYLPLLLSHKLKESPRNEALMHIAGFIGMAVTGIGVTFKIMHWPGAGLLLLSGISALGFMYIPIYFYKKYQSSSNKPVTLSASLVAMTCLILVFALINVKSSSEMNRGLAVLSEQLENTGESFTEMDALYAKVEDQQHVAEMKEKADHLYNRIEEMKHYIIAQTEGVSMEAASEMDMLHTNSRFAYDIPTHIMFGKDEEHKAYDIRTLISEFDAYESVVLDVYDPELRRSIAEMMPIDLDKSYTIKGEQTDWVTYHFHRIPLIGVISELSNIQVNVRNAEMQALIYLISQPSASNPPSGS